MDGRTIIVNEQNLIALKKIKQKEKLHSIDEVVSALIKKNKTPQIEVKGK